MSTGLRWMLPTPWLSVAGLALFVAALVFSPLIGRTHGDIGYPLVTAQGWALASAGWGVLLGTRLCNLAYGMIRLRLPGIPRTLARGAVLNLLLSFGLPLLGLLAWQPPGINDAMLMGALWLGATLGLLLVSLPLPVTVLALLIIGLSPGAVHSPLLSVGFGTLAVLLAGLAWRWQLGATRSAWMMPLGVALDGRFEHLLQPAAKARSVTHPANTRKPGAQPTGDRLAALLGPVFQTLRQQYGRRAQGWSYLGFIATTGFILWLQGQQTAGFVSCMAIASLVLVASQPSRVLAPLRSSGHATLAELHLLPGLPDRVQLPRAMAAQLLASQGEKLLIVGLTMGALGTTWPRLNAAWLLGLAGFTLLLLLFALWMALLAWHWPNKPVLRVVSMGGVISAGIASSMLLHLHGELPTHWMAGWGVLAIAMIVGTGALYQRVQATAQAT